MKTLQELFSDPKREGKAEQIRALNQTIEHLRQSMDCCHTGYENKFVAAMEKVADEIIRVSQEPEPEKLVKEANV